ncbi:phage tail tube protein [Acinetobacter sp. Ac_5812]|uniref:phage tail tube protein n=1 Tax=Acinetobacter sp. Ac_5812 TaxID=1848937 RepID=UPI00148FBA2E|nr:phage tail tube protein [Acinetobacter sp. Ac_5812]NNP68962.1 phage tail protein [Acinetobacter sp. Ac_5812]
MANNTNRLAGIANISVDGMTYLLSGEFTYSPGDVERKSLIGQDQVHGYSEMPRAPFISCTLRDAGSLTVKDFNAMTDVTIHAELANGKTIIGRNMWTIDPQEVKTQEGTFEVRFEGMSGSVTEN